MAEFLSLVTPEQALRTLNTNVRVLSAVENVAPNNALGRVVAQDVNSPEDLPAFERSTMDGYAVRAADTYGASDGLPAYLRVIGEMPMGSAASLRLGKGEAVKTHTGGAIAEGADAVVMIENTQSIDSTLEISKSVAPGENLVRVGDDIRVGHTIFRRGHLVRPQDVGVLTALGIAQIAVFQPPKVAIISAGDEVISPDKTPLPGQVRDINTYTLSALVREAGGVPLPQGIMKDDFESLLSAARRAILAAEVLIISSGSSVSTRDMTSRVISSLGKPGVLVHGVSLRPGKPTILAAVEGKPVLGLPGNPVSAMVVFDLFARPIIYQVAGCDTPPLPPTVTARLTRNIPSTTGREDYVPVSLEMTEGILFATPIFGESNLITTLVHADGVAKVPLDKHGLTEGEMVSVRIF